MILEQRNSKDIMQQISAAESAIYNVTFSLIENHTENSIQNIVQSGGENKDTQKLMQSLKSF